MKSACVEKLLEFLPVKNDHFTGGGSLNTVEILERE